MPWQAFLLDSNATGYSAALTALASYTNAKQDFTDAQVLRDAGHDSTLKIVFANVTEAEIDSDADLADARQNSWGEFEGTELCRHRWYTLADFRVRGFHMLGESERSNVGVAGQEYFVVRQKTRQASGNGAGPGYGEGTGHTLYDAADGCEDTSVFTLGTWPEGGALIDFCEPLHKNRVEQASGNDGTDTNGFMDFPVGDFASDPLTCRQDNPCLPGAITEMQDHDWLGGDLGNAWTQDGTNPNMWSRPTSSVDNTKMVYYIDPTMKSDDVLQKGFLENVADVATCRSTDWSFFADGAGTLYVNIADGRDPRHRIVQTGDTSGLWNIEAALHDATTRSKGIHFIHFTFVNCGNMAGSGGKKTVEGDFRGCRFLAGTVYRPENCGPGMFVGWSEDGEVPWDTSDLPDPSTDIYIARAVGKGSSQAVWDTISRWCQFVGTSAGVYESGAGFTDKGGFVVRGMYGREIGEIPSYAAARNMPDIWFESVDDHLFGTQGQSNMDVSYVYGYRSPGASLAQGLMELFAISDTGACQNMQNNAITDFVLVGGPLIFSGDGAYKRRDGTGLLDGNVVRRFCIAELPQSESDTVFNGVRGGGVGISHNWTERIEVGWGHFLNVGNCLDGQVNVDMCQNGGSAQNPLRGMLCGNSFWGHDNTYEDWGTPSIPEPGRVHHFRETGWHQSLDTIVSITLSNPVRVEVTGHGYPDFSTPAAGVYGHPEVYFDNMVGTTELDGNVYYAVWIDANHFDLYTGVDANGDPTGPVDGAGFGTFTSGGCARAQIGGHKMENNTFIKSGVTSSSPDIFKYGNNNYTLDEMQNTVSGFQQHLPGCADVAYEDGSELNP